MGKMILIAVYGGDRERKAVVGCFCCTYLFMVSCQCILSCCGMKQGLCGLGLKEMSYFLVLHLVAFLLQSAVVCTVQGSLRTHEGMPVCM